MLPQNSKEGKRVENMRMRKKKVMSMLVTA
jgi:hypothetical protein